MTFARTKIQPPRRRAAFVARGALQARMASARQDAAWSRQSGAANARRLERAAVIAAVRGNAPAAVDAANARYRGYSGGAPSGWHRYLLAIFSARVVAACGCADELRVALSRVDAERVALPAGAQTEAVLLAQQRCRSHQIRVGFDDLNFRQEFGERRGLHRVGLRGDEFAAPNLQAERARELRQRQSLVVCESADRSSHRRMRADSRSARQAESRMLMSS